MTRIEGLRQAALEHTHSLKEFLYKFYKRYSESKECSEYKKYADAFYYAFTNLRAHISDGELIVGKVCAELTPEEAIEWEGKYKAIADSRIKRAGGGQDSHMAIDYDLLLSCGTDGIIDKIDGCLAVCDDEEKREFYEAARLCLCAIAHHSENYANVALRLAEAETDGERKNELKKIAEVCKKVPRRPAQSFREAVQSVHFVTYCLSFNPLRYGYQQFQLGHPDRYLYPYYKKDIERGALTRDEAQLLLDCLGIQINMRVPRGLSSGYMICGRDEDGRVVENELSDMLMQVVEDVRLVYPAVGLCYNEEVSDTLLERACDILLKGRSHPAIFNDDIIINGLTSYGVPESEARNYIHSTCVEITPTASSNAWVASPYTNMAQLLLDSMAHEYESFDEHLSALLLSLDKSIEKNFRIQEAHRQARRDGSLNPLLSCFVNDCLERGIDIECGGARYNWIMPSFVGMANLVDSLYAIKILVYDEKKYTVCQLKEILDSDFAGHEELKEHLICDLPKYGNDIDEIDGYFGLFTAHIIEKCKQHVSFLPKGNLIPSVFCWEMHEKFGRETGATPDGRQCGFPLGDGSGPCQGREMRGPSASILSATKWEHHELIGGVAVNMKFAKSTLGSHSKSILKGLIKAYIQRGGFEMQINVTDRELLERAIKEPEKYRDLVVRIGGYSDYFVKLSPEMQREVMLRTEHKI